MNWSRAPYYSIHDLVGNKFVDGDNFKFNAIVKTRSAKGFLGGYFFNNNTDRHNPGVEKNISLHKALIQMSQDNWKTRTTVFEGSGEIEAFLNVGNGSTIARNTQVDQETLHSSTQFLITQDSKWEEASKLEFYIKKVYGSESQWLLAVGFPDESPDSVYIMVSSSGAKKWYQIQLEGFTSPDKFDSIALVLSGSGKLYRFNSFQLDFIDLNRTEAIYHWNSLPRAPSPLRDPFMLLRDNRIMVLGNYADSTFGIWNMRVDGTGPNSIQECTGIPKGFTIDRFEYREDALYLIGTVLIKKDDEVRGIEWYLLRSDQVGKHWVDLQLPITSGLQAVDFGEDGSIWASAPGNRIQIFEGKDKD